MLKKLRRALAEVEHKKFKQFADFERIITKIRKEYVSLFPNFKETKNGSSYVYHFNVRGVSPISLEKEHGSREFIPHKFAKRAIQCIEDLLTYIEAVTPDEQIEAENEVANETPNVDVEEAAGILPEPEIPDGDSRG